MGEIWTKSKTEYYGEFVNFEPIMAWPKPVQKPHPPIHDMLRVAAADPLGQPQSIALYPFLPFVIVSTSGIPAADAAV
jgi:hypothetical protein